MSNEKDAADASRGGSGDRSRRRPVSAAQTVYMAVRDEIVAMRLTPGAVLLEKQISHNFGVSRTPVREALLKLAGEGLVDIFPQSGTFVSRIPYDALPEVMVIRCALEQASARFAAERATEADVAALRANIAAQRDVPCDDNEGFHLLDEAFHALISDIAGYSGIWTLTRQVKVQVDRCRRLIMPRPGRRKEAIDEHEAIADAIAAHDVAAAVQTTAVHMDRVQDLIEKARASTPEYFASGGKPERPDKSPQAGKG